jgi:hypothetical protein
VRQAWSAAFRRAATLLLIAAAAAATTLALYLPTLRYGFDYDDYHFVRPHAAAEVLNAFSGPWDPTGIEVALYRPLTVAWFALRFELLGLNAVACHAVSLALFAAAAALFGVFVLRISGGRTLTALLGTAVFAAHPSMPYALVCWTTNQMHLLATMTVLLALLWWTVARGRPLRWWLPLIPLQGVAFLVKEDGIMLLPAVIVLHGLHRRIVAEQTPPAPRAFLAMAALTLAAAVAVRSMALGGLGGYGFPGAEQAWANVSRGLKSVFWLVPARRPWQPEASWFAILLPVAGVAAAWVRRERAALFCLAGGVALAALFDLPFAFVTKVEQYHLIATGASLALTGAAAATAGFARALLWRLGAGAVIAGGVLAMALVARHISRDFEPFGSIVLAHDAIVEGWAAVPIELREYLGRKREPGAAARMSSNPIDEVPVVSWGLLGQEKDEAGTPYRWLGGLRGDLFVTERARLVQVPVRHLIEFPRTPVDVGLEANGRLVDHVVLRSREWHVLQAPLRAAGAPGLGGLHRLRLTVDKTWSPVEVIPGSTDARVFGVQVGEITVR